MQEESHAGRELVINETHGALSTNLRLLEQQTREVRSVAPALHDLAVSANSRLRETLTLARLGPESSTSVQNLEAPVLTLARAVGARAEVVVTVDRLGPDDRDLARLVLNDLVGNALNAGAGDVRVTIAAGRSAGRHLGHATTPRRWRPGSGRLPAPARPASRRSWPSCPAR